MKECVQNGFKVCTFEMSGKVTDSDNVASKTVVLTLSQPLSAIFCHASGQVFENVQVWAALGLVTVPYSNQ